MIRLISLVNYGKVFQKEAMDPVGKEDKDIDNDGDADKSDQYLKNRRDAIGAAMKKEGEDHEVSMAHSALDDIIKNATELKAKMGAGEKDVPAWIQDHISQAQNFINQASTNYHEHGAPKTSADAPSPIQEKEGPCWKGYQQIGMKMKNGKEVPNCVPID